MNKYRPESLYLYENYYKGDDNSDKEIIINNLNKTIDHNIYFIKRTGGYYFDFWTRVYKILTPSYNKDYYDNKDSRVIGIKNYLSTINLY